MLMRFVFPAVLVLAALYPVVAGSSGAFLAIVFMKAMPVLGIILLLQAGQVSFGHALYFAAGAYTAGFLARDFGMHDLFLLLVLGTAVSVAVGVVVGAFVVRYRYIFFAMLNLAFSMVLYSLLEKFFHITGGSDGLRIDRPTVFGMELRRGEYEMLLYYVSLVCLGGSLYGLHLFLDSPLGHALKAIKSNETRVEYLGLSPRMVLLVAYVVSAAVAGLGGTLIGVFQGIATPDYAYWVRSGEFVFVAILGGAGHVLGALAGSFVYEFIRQTAAAYVGDTWQLALGVVLLVIVLFAPSGLVGMLTSGALRRRRRAASGAPASGDLPVAREPQGGR